MEVRNVNWDKFYRFIFIVSVLLTGFFEAIYIWDDNTLLVTYILLFGIIIGYLEK